MVHGGTTSGLDSTDSNQMQVIRQVSKNSERSLQVKSSRENAAKFEEFITADAKEQEDAAENLGKMKTSMGPSNLKGKMEAGFSDKDMRQQWSNSSL